MSSLHSCFAVAVPPSFQPARRRWRPLAVLFAMLAGWAQLRAADLDRAVEFNVPAGEAAAALREFGAQAGTTLLYPPELTQGVRTPAVRGRLTAKQALDHLLADTGLSAWQDEQTGTFAIGRARNPRRSETVQLPPFVVEAKTEPPQWWYAEGPGVEVLSQCSEQVTLQLVAQHYVLNSLLQLIVPAALQRRSDLPTTYLFFDRGKSGIAQELLNFLRQREAEIAAAKKAGGRKGDSETLVGALPNFRFWDQDTMAAFFVWDDLEGSPALMPASSYVRYLLEGRAPSLPRWYVDGMMELYRSVSMKTKALSGDGYARTSLDHGFTLPFGQLGEYSVSFRKGVWISDEITEHLVKSISRSESHYYQQLAVLNVAPVSLAEAFSDLPAPTPQIAQVRTCTRALFLRGKLANEQSRQELWKFVDAASRQPITEALFRDCFHETYETADRQLPVALATAIMGREKLTISPPQAPETPSITLRRATAAEIARLKGGFNRLEIAYVRELYPEVTGKYVEQARTTLHKAYDSGDRDPRLLAELGLCECDAGNDARALPLLEAAAQAEVKRPRVYYEIARIRFAALRAAAPSAPLSARQLATLLEPLRVARGYSPPLAEVYELTAEAWLRSSLQPDREQLMVLLQGVDLFPYRARLRFSVALLAAAQGQAAAARTLVDRGLAVSEDNQERARLLKLQSALAPPGT